jgi:alpha/beta superfamily hydrolase
MNKLLVVFSHGKESGPLGSKIQALMRVAEQQGAQTMSVNYREHPDGTAIDHDAPGEADRRVAQLLATSLPGHDRLVLVGSSMGGYVSTVASSQLKPDGLFLLAPAFYLHLPGYACQDPVPHATSTLVVHGWGDDVVPPDHSVRFARQHRCALHLLVGDHRLDGALPAIEPLFGLFLQGILAAGSAPPATAR